MRELTTLQAQRLDDLIKAVARSGFFPTYRQVSERWSVQLNAAQQTIAALERKGYVRAPRPNKSEPGRILRRADGSAYSHVSELAEIVRLPIAGETTAGAPMLAEERLEGHLILSSDLRRGLDSCFVLRVHGDSMVGLHILDRDLAIVRKQSTAENGDIVVVRIGDEATIKTFRRNKSIVRLEPANPRFNPIEIKASQCVIEGKVVGLLRLA
jgi:repressor LexA